MVSLKEGAGNTPFWIFQRWSLSGAVCICICVHFRQSSCSELGQPACLPFPWPWPYPSLDLYSRRHLQTAHGNSATCKTSSIITTIVLSHHDINHQVFPRSSSQSCLPSTASPTWSTELLQPAHRASLRPLWLFFFLLSLWLALRGLDRRPQQRLKAEGPDPGSVFV